MEQRQKKILLLILLVVFLGLVTHQLRKIVGRSQEIASIPISSQTAPGREARISSVQAKSLLPELNLELLNQPMPDYSVLGRNLFRFGAAKVAAPASARRRPSSQQKQKAASRKTEGGVVANETTAEEEVSAPGSSPALEELAGFKFLGFARKDSQMIATLKKGDKILVGIKGDIIEERFAILEIDYQYIELGVVNTSVKQKIPLVNGSF